MLYLFFFLSGISGLIYQVIWVRIFGNVFGNTVHSASVVVAVFMLGLGVGSFVAGEWSDRRYVRRPESLVSAYGWFELIVGATGLGIAALLPHLAQVSAGLTSYVRDPNGWYVLSTASYLARVAIAVVLLAPATLLMGGTLTLLIRYLVRSDLAAGGRRIAVLYGVNTLGAATGCLLTDFALVPIVGLQAAQILAAGINFSVGLGALVVATRARSAAAPRRAGGSPRSPRRGRSSDRVVPDIPNPLALPMAGVALGLAGFAAMGMEILWFRHFTILLGGFRAVFALLLAILLVATAAGSLIAGWTIRRFQQPARSWMVVQGLFVATALLGLAAADAMAIGTAVRSDPAYLAAAGAAEAAAAVRSGLARTMTELWFNAKPMLVELTMPALLMGFSFPLGNAVVQQAEQSVGRRAGLLYLSNTAGAVAGSLTAGFLLLPELGIQVSATVLMMAAALAIVPLSLTGGSAAQRAFKPATIGSFAIAVVSLGVWLLLPSDYVIGRALAHPLQAGERLLTERDGLTEVVAVTEVPGKGRALLTNGHPMSSTAPFSQRYMRALAHIPLLSIDRPETVLVIGFGVGNTTHAAALHPTVRRIEVADLSRNILSHASFFAEGNRDVLKDPRVSVYVNDGRQHLYMAPAASYDLITLEPPPVAYAGVASLYSREFYSLARSRLKPKGFLSQWLPAYQVPAATTLSMIRAFVDVFPEAVLVSGSEADLLLLGVNDSRIEIDPQQVALALSDAPAVEADLRRLDLGTVREIVGTFVGSARTLREATRDAIPTSDDLPVQEYAVSSVLSFEAVPASVVDLSAVREWCAKCFANDEPVALVEGLDTYLALLDLAYRASPADVARARRLGEREGRIVAGSKYLGAIVPETRDLHNVLGIGFATQGRFDDAIVEFRRALQLDPGSAATEWHLGSALASRGAVSDAADHLRRSVALDASNGQAQYDLGVVLTQTGRLDEAIDHFQFALRSNPDFAEARRGLEAARARRSGGSGNAP